MRIIPCRFFLISFFIAGLVRLSAAQTDSIVFHILTGPGNHGQEVLHFGTDTFGSNNLIKCSYYFGESNKQWFPFEKIFYQYDNQNHLLEKSDLQATNTKLDLYTYDQNGNMLSHSYQSIDSNPLYSPYAYSDTVMYDSANYLKQVIQCSYNDSQGFYYHYKNVYVNDFSGNRICDTGFSWVNSSWQFTTLNKIYYTLNGKIDSGLSFRWNSLTLAWDTTMHSYHFYNSAGDDTCILDNGLEKRWYNQNHQVVSDTMYIPINGYWPDAWYHMDYDSSGNLIASYSGCTGCGFYSDTLRYDNLGREIYNYVVQCSHGGNCSSSRRYSFYPDRDSLMLVTLPAKIICNGDSAQFFLLNADSTIQVNWSPASLVDTIHSFSTKAFPDSSMFIFCQATDHAGNLFSDSVQIHVDRNDYLQIQPADSITICPAQTFNLFIDSGLFIYPKWFYQGIYQSQSNYYPAVHEGEYICQAMFAGSKCPVSDTAVLVLDNVISEIEVDTLSDGYLLKSHFKQPSWNYQWFLNDSIIHGAVSPEITTHSTGFYSLKISGATGCMDESQKMYFDNTSVFYNRDNYFSVSSTGNGIFNIYLTAHAFLIHKSLNFELFDDAGKLRLEIPVTEKTLLLDLSGFSRGIYLLRLTGENSVLQTEKVLNIRN